MERKVVSGILLALLLMGMLTLTFDVQPCKTEPTTIVVPDNYLTIQEAVNAANPEDTIFVKAGTYYEHVIVNKTVSLIGEGANVTTTSGNRRGRTVVIAADNVTISNFRIEEGGWNIIDNDCNVFINGSGTRILNCDIKSSVILVFVESTSFCNTIEHNNLIGGTRGILLGSSVGNTIAHNYIATSGLGTVVGGVSSNNTIEDNYIKNEGGWPLILGEMNKVFNNTVVCVTSFEGFSGIVVAGGFNNMTGNTIIVSTVGAVSVFGITVVSSNNIIYHNNFFNYTQPVLIEKPVYNTWDNGYPSGGNYWSDYRGTDLHSGPYQNETGRDRIGDTAYIFDENNRDNYPLIYPYPCLTMPWDITGPTQWVPDGKCDTRDIATVARLFGSIKGDGRYDRRADITGPTYLVPDGKIDIRDIALIARNFGKTYP